MMHIELCYPHHDSVRLHSPFPAGKFRADRGRTRMKFPILSLVNKPNSCSSMMCSFLVLHQSDLTFGFP